MAPPSIDDEAPQVVDRSATLNEHDDDTVDKHAVDGKFERSKEELWKDAVCREVPDSDATVQVTGLGESEISTVWARVVSSSSRSGDTTSPSSSPEVTVGKVVELMVEEEFERLVKAILEEHRHVENDSHPPAKELLRLGSVWLVNETAYVHGQNPQARLLRECDEALVPDWDNMTLRVHARPDRFFVATEVEWDKYCKGLLLDGTVEAFVGEEKPHVPGSALPDLKDGAIVYDVR